MLNISIKGIRMPLTAAITDAVHSKVTELEKIIHTPAFVHVEIGKPSGHHKTGDDIFASELTVDVAGQTYYIHVTDSDMYTALDRSVADMLEIIKQGKGKRHTLLRRGRMAIKQLLRKGY